MHPNLLRCRPKTAGKRSNVYVFSVRIPGVCGSAAAASAAAAADGADDDEDAAAAGDAMMVWLQ